MSSTHNSAADRHFDVVIVGGGPAGLSAALVLGRMRRRVLVCDTGAPANAVSHGVGGLLSRDGLPPAELRAISREQIAAYPTVVFRDSEATGARSAESGFEVDVDGETVRARKLLLAHGLDYRLPEIEGIDSVWGDRAFHCPYCHGWEVRDQPLAVIATGARAAHQALLLRSISDDVVVLANGTGELDSDQRASLARGAIDVVDGAIERVERAGEGVRITTSGREPLVRNAVFIQPDLALPCEIAVDLGAEVDHSGTVAVDATGATGVPGLRVAGDAGTPPQSVAVAIGSGATAAYLTNGELALESVERQPD